MATTRGLPAQLRDAAAQRRGPFLLELDLSEELLEAPPTDPLGMVQAARRTSLRAVVEGLAAAARDPRVHGLIAKVGGRLPLARAQELHRAVRGFRESGKPAIAWAETFGEFAPGTAGYLLATGFAEIWLQPSGDLGLVGVSVQGVFLRGALEALGVDPQLDRRYEYKNAADLFLQRGFTEGHREASARLAASAYEQVVGAVAQARGLTEEAVRAVIDRAPLTAGEALDARLVDRLGYRDEAYAAIRARVGAEPRLVYLNRYRPPRPGGPLRRLTRRSRPAVALVHVHGAIRLGRAGRSPLTGAAAGSDTVTAALRAAVRDDGARAVVLRVNSPGGSYAASDAIWREVQRSRQAGKPVVVSMGDLAASGGYFVSMAADKILALPGTLTGSIGVLGGKFAVPDLLDRLRIGHDTVDEGRHAGMFRPARRYTDEEWQRLQDWLDRVYDDFVAKVAAGRGLAVERAQELARGRVWTGADARERGLVDELGGLRRAGDLARELAGLAPDAPLRPYPQVHPLRRLRPPRSSADPAAVTSAFGAAWGPVADLATRLGLPVDGPLLMPQVRLC